MSDLRTLLVDCRIALRGVSGAGRDDLSQRLESAIREASESGAEPADKAANLKLTSTQVALAWQTVARGLKLSHPELYGSLNERVMGLLNTRTLQEPVDELLRLEQEAEGFDRERSRLNQRLEETQKRLLAVQAQLDELHKALAAAMPEVTARDVHEQALQRLEALLARGPATAASGGGRATAAAVKESPVPAREQLEKVSAGTREFTKEQRDWVVGEALGLTGWAFTPVELVEKGDAWLANLLLEKSAA